MNIRTAAIGSLLLFSLGASASIEYSSGVTASSRDSIAFTDGQSIYTGDATLRDLESYRQDIADLKNEMREVQDDNKEMQQTISDQNRTIRDLQNSIRDLTNRVK
ncbi:TPA: hypothetical protein ACXE8V_002234 [Pluralibacter gergoviae]